MPGGKGEKRNILFFTSPFWPPFNLTFTLPGFAQSFGWLFAGSNRLSIRNLEHAAAISLARGFSTAKSLPTLLPSLRLLVASK